MDIANKIYSVYADQAEIKEKRTHLGASIIGDPCARKVFYQYHNPKPITDGRILRLFETGNIQEDRLISDLEKAGISITHKQLSFNDADDPRFAGSLDAIVNIDGVDYVVEIKTHNEKSYNDLVKKGVKVTKAQHHTQMQIYMGWSNIHKALYLAINKNDESIYTEIVDFDMLHYQGYRSKAFDILDGVVPDRLSNDHRYYYCKWCDYRKECHDIKD